MHVFSVDQQAIGPFEFVKDFVVYAGQLVNRPCGQEFRPQFAALNVVELDINTYSPGDATGDATAYVAIRHLSIDGQVVGTSDLAAVGRDKGGGGLHP
jgi:hypothetical protein